jgi:hypothetical protein
MNPYVHMTDLQRPKEAAIMFVVAVSSYHLKPIFSFFLRNRTCCLEITAQNKDISQHPLQVCGFVIKDRPIGCHVVASRIFFENK